jgi:hypothetical protein
MKYKDSSFIFVCIAIFAGVLTALSSAVHAARGLRAEETTSIVASAQP